MFNAHYLTYFDTSITELCRAAVGGYTTMLDRGVDIVVVEAQLRFQRPARFDDELMLEIAVTRMGTTSVATEHHIHHDGRPIASGTLVHVMVDRQTLSKTPIPDWLRDGLEPFSAPDG